MIFLNIEFHHYLSPFSKEESSLQRMKKLFQKKYHKTTISILLIVLENSFQRLEKRDIIQVSLKTIIREKYLCIKNILEKYSKIFPYPIHPYFETFMHLKILWVSLSSKVTFVFDTPGKDAHLYFSEGF